MNMKRIYRQRTSQKLREDTLAQLQKTRAHFENQYPELLEKARSAIAAAPEASQQNQDMDQRIDRQKTLEVIMKYAATQCGQQQDDLKKELLKFLN